VFSFAQQPFSEIFSFKNVKKGIESVSLIQFHFLFRIEAMGSRSMIRPAANLPVKADGRAK
jgi:hypothetical protein